MKNKFFILFAIAFSIACKKEHEQDAVVIQASGDIAASVNEFRQLLGSKLNTAPGATGGRREISWDAVPPEFLGKPLPLNFLNNTASDAPASQQKGFAYEDTGFQVSSNNFTEVNPAAAGQFSAFSGSNSFVNVSSELWDGRFEVPGQAVPATVKGFGAVFTDVDVANNTSIEFFSDGKSLGRFFAPVQQAGSRHSFLAVYFKTGRITGIRIQHGNGLLNKGEKDISDGGAKDLVVLDDFLYDEPVKK
jgi:hypothetical protein